MNERSILCPVCRVAVPDRVYYQHARDHQKGRASGAVLVMCTIVEIALIVAMILALKGTL